jgi:retron-type reverse transcriptase
MAYADIAPNKGAATPGTDGQSLDGYSEQRVRSIIARLMGGTYRFTPARRVTIPKASGNPPERGHSGSITLISSNGKLPQPSAVPVADRI